MRRIVITGIGVLSAIGNGKEEFLDGLLTGRCGTAPLKSLVEIERYPFQSGAEIKGFSPEKFDVTEWSSYDETTQTAVAAAKMAVEDAGLSSAQLNRFRTGVSIATSLGGVNARERFYREKKATGVARHEYILNVPTSAIAGNVAKEFDVRGPLSTVVTACAAGGNAIGCATDYIRDGKADVMIAGGVDPYSAISFSGFTVLKSLSKSTCRPFNEDRDGLTLGEASAIVIVEELEHALARGARIYAEVLGYGISNDAYHATSPDPKGGGAIRSMLAALRDAGLSPEDIDYINAHGTGTPYNDSMELHAIQEVFGERAKQVPISSSKSQLGHTLGTAGAVEFVTSVLALYHHFLPATINSSKPLEEGFDFVPNEVRHQAVKTILSNSFAFGGNTASVVVGAYEA
ncbi:beta-ketoacyl-[acyl-carrier-protein] synthase family protein [Tumebacillus sp. ITR2]|uniref:Beta-ketoacyl-[acyl-carrier-protein] synthase family protein n=1 Tax=Tumebacillus amylolyticus TaxID=2801339 RepID=A0ABS1JB04_9BACL|nr:beta-ketoacyl-[acyl-carrier-protein] synthase family protein [Tumebacillus amylolyticus]